MKVKYICVKDISILLCIVNTNCQFVVGDIVYLRFAYNGTFGARYLVYLYEDDDYEQYRGDFYDSDMVNFMNHREYTIDKVLKND